jgi:hypothetical protein
VVQAPDCPRLRVGLSDVQLLESGGLPVVRPGLSVGQNAKTTPQETSSVCWETWTTHCLGFGADCPAFKIAKNEVGNMFWMQNTQDWRTVRDPGLSVIGHPKGLPFAIQTVTADYPRSRGGLSAGQEISANKVTRLKKNLDLWLNQNQLPPNFNHMVTRQ